MGGDFTQLIPKAAGQFSQVTMTLTQNGNTSEFSENFTLTPAPLIVVAYSPVNIIITDPLHRQFGKDSLGNLITGIPDGWYSDPPDDSVVIAYPIMGGYIIDFVAEAGAPAGSTYSSIIRVDGTQQVTIVADDLIPSSGTTASFNYDLEEGYHYVNGDANRDGAPNVGDAVFLINFVFKSGPGPDPLGAGDANCDHDVNVGDAVKIINYVFKSGEPPCYFEP
jgi:hypothetical protein